MRKAINFIIIAIVSIFMLCTFNNCSIAVNSTENLSTSQETTSSGQITTTVSSTSSADSSFLSIGNI